jgi:O-antigen/teichoic acid export membrane protein
MVSAASLTLATRIAAFVFSLASNIILARSLGPEGRGIYAVAVLIPAVVAMIAQLGFQAANVYHTSKRLLPMDEIVGHSVSLALLLGTVCFGVILGYIELTHSTRFLGIGSEFVLISCVALPFSLATIFFQGIQQGAERFVQFNVVLLTQYAAPAVCLFVALVLLRGQTLGAVGAWTASAILTSLVAAWGVGRLARLSLRLRVPTVRMLLRFGIFSYLGTLTSFVNYRFDVFLVNFFSGARQVGLYSVGTGLAEVVWYLANAAGIVLAPRVASAGSQEGDRVTEAVTRVVALLALMAAGGLALLAPFVVVLFFGAAFAESAWAVWLLLPGIVTFSVGRILSMYLLGRNRLKVDLVASFVGLVLTLTLDLLLIPRFGFRGAAVASSIAYTVAMLVNLVWVVRNSSITVRGLLVAQPSDVAMLLRRVQQIAGAGVSVLSSRGR